MRLLLLASRCDPAGMAILESFRSQSSDAWLHEVSTSTIEGSLLDCEPAPGYDLIIFLSRHSAQSGLNAMCVHAIGNFGEASLGGREGMLVPTHPGVLTALYRSLSAQNPKTALGSYTVSLEAVHHGPYTTTPSIFYELGSSPVQWDDREAAQIMALVLSQTLSTELSTRESFFGFGSNHYCAGLSDLTETYDFAGSCPRYALGSVTDDQLRWIADRYDRIVLHKRSMGPEKRRIIRMLDDLGIAYD
jgi:D-aminoacyl-tRNA deacylase